jgi:hypothetical protein
MLHDYFSDEKEFELHLPNNSTVERIGLMYHNMVFCGVPFFEDTYDDLINYRYFSKSFIEFCTRNPQLKIID